MVQQKQSNVEMMLESVMHSGHDYHYILADRDMYTATLWLEWQINFCYCRKAIKHEIDIYIYISGHDQHKSYCDR